MEQIILSPLGHTWILDLDGTIIKHNGYKTDGYDSFLDGAESFLRDIPETDMIVFITSRTDAVKEVTEKFLAKHGIRYNQIIYNAPFGERILINDCKPSGLRTIVALNIERDIFPKIQLRIDEKL